MDSGEFGIKPSFGVEISGALAGNVPVPAGLIVLLCKLSQKLHPLL